MRKRIIHLRIGFLCALLLGGVLAHATGQPKRVLVLNSFGPNVAFWDDFAAGLRDELTTQMPGGVEVYETQLLSARFETPAGDDPLVGYLGALFENRPLSLVVTVGTPAALFVQGHREKLFSSTPALLSGMENRRLSREKLTPNDATATFVVDIPDVLANILRILPKTHTIVVVTGNSPSEQYWQGQIRDAARPFSSKVRFVWTNDWTFEQLLRRVSSLPQGSAILYLLQSPDVPDAPTGAYAAFEKVYAAANAPIFSTLDMYFGRGLVGGPLISIDELSHRAADAAVRILRGEPAASVRLQPARAMTPAFDFRELRRWQIPDSDLPPGSSIRFRPPGMWQQYRWFIAAVSVVVLLESALILSLLHERRGRRRAELESHQRLAELALINRRATAAELSASIAHELRQPIAAILFNAEAAELMLRGGTADAGQLRDIIADIIRDDRRAAEVMQRVRQLLSRAPARNRPIDLNQLLIDVFGSMETHLSARGIHLSLMLSSTPVTVVGDPIQLHQVILNLVMNAADAMTQNTANAGGGGSMANAASGARITGRVAVSDGTAEVVIADRGPGIAPQDRDKLFEPFFTTKSDGMGMGLSISRSIIDMHGGRIWAENDPAGGARLVFRLPLAGRMRADRMATETAAPSAS